MTTGATASFDRLVETVLSGPFLAALSAANYTDLLVQYGKSGSHALDRLREWRRRGEVVAGEGVSVDGFAFNQTGLGQEMRAAKGGDKAAEEGVVVSHAGECLCFLLLDG